MISEGQNEQFTRLVNPRSQIWRVLFYNILSLWVAIRFWEWTCIRFWTFKWNIKKETYRVPAWNNANHYMTGEHLAIVRECATSVQPGLVAEVNPVPLTGEPMLHNVPKLWELGEYCWCRRWREPEHSHPPISVIHISETDNGQNNTVNRQGKLNFSILILR